VTVKRPRRADALQLFLDLSGRIDHPDDIQPGTGFRVYNWPEVIKDALFNTDNHDIGIEDKMVEALSTLLGLPQERITADAAATELQQRLMDEFAVQLCVYMMTLARVGQATTVLALQSEWGTTTAMELLIRYSRETDGALPAKVQETIGALGGDFGG
jgi:hypothetical protein